MNNTGLNFGNNMGIGNTMGNPNANTLTNSF